jgi:hypothetical protein
MSNVANQTTKSKPKKFSPFQLADNRSAKIEKALKEKYLNNEGDVGNITAEQPSQPSISSQSSTSSSSSNLPSSTPLQNKGSSGFAGSTRDGSHVPPQSAAKAAKNVLKPAIERNKQYSNDWAAKSTAQYSSQGSMLANRPRVQNEQVKKLIVFDEGLFYLFFMLIV